MIVSALCLSRGNQTMLDAAYADWCAQSVGDEFVVACDEGDPVIAPGMRVDVPRGTNLGAKRNAALRAATGNIVVVWDDDDGHDARRVRTQLAPILVGYDASTFCEVMLQAEGRPNMVASLLCGWPQTLMMRRKALLALGGWPENARLDGDLQLLMRIHSQSASFRLRCETPMYTYRQHGDNVMGSRHWDSIWENAMPPEKWRRVFARGREAEERAHVA